MSVNLGFEFGLFVRSVISVMIVDVHCMPVHPGPCDFHMKLTRYEVLRHVHSSPAFCILETSEDISFNEYIFFGFMSISV